MALLCAIHAGPSWSQSDDAQAESVSAYWRDKAFAPPRVGGEEWWRSESAAPIPRQQLELFQRQLQMRIPSRNATPFDLLDSTTASLAAPPWWNVVDGPGQYGNWPELTPTSQEQPEAARQILARAMAALSSKSRSSPAKPLYAGRRKATWNKDDYEHLVLAGPGVKEGVATYRAQPSSTRIRVPLFDAELPGRLFLWARNHGAPIQVALRAAADPPSDSPPEPRDAQIVDRQPPFIADAQTDLPAWIVTSKGLLPARLTSFSTVGAGNGSGACSGSDWVELTLEGDTQPAVWAVLIGPQTDLHKDAVVRRLPSKKDGDHYGEGQRGEIELRWPDSIPALRVIARRFDYIEHIYDETADGKILPAGERTLGSAWGVQVFNADTYRPRTPEGNTEPPLAASGSPRCAPP